MTTITKTENYMGTSLQGHVTTTRMVLEAVFGEPEIAMDSKTHYNWAVEITTDLGETTVATIYDWKTERDIAFTELFEWNVGGNSHRAAYMVKYAINNYFDEEEKK